MILIRYLGGLSVSRIILWSYFIWWVVMVSYHFSADGRLWLTSLGIGVIVGYALLLNTGPVTLARFRNRFWESFRLFLTPVLVSSFSAQVAGAGFMLVFSPHWKENIVACGSIGIFLLLVKVSHEVLNRGSA